MPCRATLRPTGEVELLLSGALVFSMLQVPPLIDSGMFSIRPRITEDMQAAVFVLYFYLKLTTYALIITFILHLASRAIWVAALGLRSVYPEGILWDKLGRRPIFREFAERTTPTLNQMIDRADNRASLVFAFGLLLAMMSIAIMIFTLLMIIPISLIEMWLGRSSESSMLTFGVFGALLLPMMLGPLLDRQIGSHLPTDHWLTRAIRVIYRISGWMLWGRITQPIMLTIFSRLGLTRGNLIVMALLYSLMGLITVEVMVQTGAIRMPGEQYLPSAGREREFLSEHYSSTRSERDSLQGAPFIQDEIVAGPYLKLFVAYVPKRLAACRT